MTTRVTRATDTMTLPITVVTEDAGNETDPDGQTTDPGLRVDVKGRTCASRCCVSDGAATAGSRISRSA